MESDLDSKYKLPRMIMDYYGVVNGEFVVLDQTLPQNEGLQKGDGRNYIKNILRKAVVNSQCYGFTLTFRSKLVQGDPIVLHRSVQRYLARSQPWMRVNYIMFPEFTKKGCLHYHGLTWNSYQAPVIKCMASWRRKYGFVKLELVLRSTGNWVTYISKCSLDSGLWCLTNEV